MLAIGVATTALGLVVVGGVLVPPLLPNMSWSVPRASRVARSALSRAKRDRERERARKRLFASISRHVPVPGTPASRLPIAPEGALTSNHDIPESLVAAFYVNWDDNSFASFRAHASAIDWLVCEWAFLTTGGDSLRLRLDNRVLYTVQRMPEAERPRLFVMVSNFDSSSKAFGGVPALRKALTNRHARARIVEQLDSVTSIHGLAGVTIDFEEVPASLRTALVELALALKERFAGSGRLVTVTAAATDDQATLRALASASDKLFLMDYDEHYGAGDPGPVASQRWYEARARDALRAVPADKIILAMAAYGYDWNDAEPNGEESEVTFQDAMAAARDHDAPVLFDSVSLNPYLSYSDADSTDHLVWFLDAVSAHNQLLVGEKLHLAGSALWRLGAEDPSVWRVLTRAEGVAPVAQVAEIPGGYDVEFEGQGELLQITRRPTVGTRVAAADSASGLIVSERITRLPSPYVVRRTGASHPGWVSLTFDDGPDGTWTPQILDTLRSRGVNATFFLIGEHVETHIALTRRLVSEGHEFGNHTFTHPNLALTSTFVTRLELDATERLLESVLDRRSALFRPPYFGDAEPTTADELVPVGIAGDLGYVTAGLHVDSDDWTEPPPDTIVRRVLDRRQRGNVVLLHDGGGNRSSTVAALGPLIDSLRERGDTLVLLSSLAGLTPDQAMPRLPVGGAVLRFAELASFGAVGVVQWLLYWLFAGAVVLGIARLLIITALAAVQRVRSHRQLEVGDAVSVSVIVPAYNEEKVVVQTVRSLLDQDYAGELTVIVVDDGSADGTYNQARGTFAGDPRVTVIRQENGGKASALNTGIARSRGEIVVCLDADTVFQTDTVRHIVAPFGDPTVGAVAGNAKVGNRVNIVTRWQAIEYVTSQNLDRRAFSLLNCVTVVPGAVGAWRRALVLAAGGFRADTLAEDQDLTLRIRRAGHRIAYADNAVAYTEAPDTLRALAKQRFRWSFGTLQCIWKHRDALFRPRYGALGFVALPNVLLFQLIFAALSPLADLMFLWSLVSVWLVRVEHGATYALVELEHVLVYYAVFLLVDWVASVIAFLMEPGEDRQLTWLVLLQRFVYRQLMYWVVVRSFVAAFRGQLVGWGKLERKATVAPHAGRAA